MKRNRIQNRCIATCLTLITMLLTSVGINAQNVTVSPSKGNMIASVPENISGTSGDYDTFFRRGGFATWRHNQLSLTMTVSDATALTDNGQLKNPANNLYANTITDEIEMGRGAGNSATRNCYMNIALPKGYRFTGYEIVFSWNKEDFGENGYENNPHTSGTMRFGETSSKFTYKTGYYQDITYNENATLGNGSVSIKHEDKTGMSNILYFRLTDANTGAGRMVVTFHSITLYFTPEDNYTPVAPNINISSNNAVSAVNVPFQTSKVDYGTIQERDYNDDSRISYSSANVKDLSANFILYEAESTTTGTDIDGTSGQVVEFKSGSISTESGYFRLGSGDEDEQVYFIETPTSVLLSDNKTKIPVGYRIVGAQFDFKPTTVEAGMISKTDNYDTFVITATHKGWSTTTYYLTNNGGYTSTEGQAAVWFLDENGYIRLVEDPTKYLKNGNNNLTAISYSSSNKPAQFIITNNGQIALKANTAQTIKWNNTSSRFQLSNSSWYDTANRAVKETNKSITADIPKIINARLNVYDKTGNTVQSYCDGQSGTIILDHLNNDAVKFGVIGIGQIKGSLTVQALDPYLDNMSVVCQDQEVSAIRMTQTFTADDFTVNGGEFWFFLPEDCSDHDVAITYEDLNSKYFDETYDGGSEEHNSRMSFVKSEHYNAFDGTAAKENNVYNNTAEAAAGIPDNPETENVVEGFRERQKVSTVGSVAFKFNNAKEVGQQGGTLVEYPFSLKSYTGTFDNMIFNVDENKQDKTAYVFTTDETRYNIAPTTATQHRTYAFYEMIVHVRSASYTPIVEIKKVYASSCSEENGKPVTVPYYGAVITAPYGNPAKAGFASDIEIEEAINRVILTDKKDDFNNTDVPNSRNQILYLDLSGLAGYYTNADYESHNGTKPLVDYKNDELADNALIFLPAGVTTHDNNFAYMTKGGEFRSANNIIITDKKPFFSPYEIQVPADNHAYYKREISAPANGAVTNATIMLPFTLDVDANGIHTNTTADGFKFQLHKMTKMIVNGEIENQRSFEGNAVFTKITPAAGNKALGHTPYMVKVLEGAPEGATFSFIVTQEGSNILPSPTENNVAKVDILGEKVTGTVNSQSCTFTNYGTYSGKVIPKENNVFYFNKNKYVSSLNLPSRYSDVYVQPFRAYYATSGLTPTTQNAKMMTGFDISYDLFSDNGGITTSLTETTQPKVMTINTGNGSMLITAAEDIQVKIMGANGVSIDNFKMNAGEQRQVNVPSGIYIVNNTKILVK